MRRQEQIYHVVPVQRRSRAVESRIVAATSELVSSIDYTELTVAHIVLRADTSVGAFYRRFSSKEALLSFLYRRYARSQSARGALISARRGRRDSLPATCELVARAIVREHRRQRGLLRAAALAVEARPDQFGRVVDFCYPPLCARAAPLFEPYAPSIRHRDPRKAVRFGLSAAVSACRARILFGAKVHINEAQPADDALTRELTRMLSGYLTNTGHVS